MTKKGGNQRTQNEGAIADPSPDKPDGRRNSSNQLGTQALAGRIETVHFGTLRFDTQRSRYEIKANK